MFTLKPLPYDIDALEPHMSKETLEYHYGRHHRGYVDKLNSAIEGSRLEEFTLEKIVRDASDEGIFRNAAQAWNHEFFWHCLDPQGSGEPSGRLADALTASFGSFGDFREQFTNTASDIFGSGWAWLIKSKDDHLQIVATSNADTPLTRAATPLLTCDMWEHAYYVDHRNDRSTYLDAFWRLVNWKFVSQNFETSKPLAEVKRIVATA